MDFELTSSPKPRSRLLDDAGFSLSATPVVSGEETGATGADELPRSQGNEALYLMARDPHSVFAFWDIDWVTAFGEPAPRERKVHFALQNADGSEVMRMEVEPTAGNCLVEELTPDTAFRAVLGYESAGQWVTLATSAVMTTPTFGLHESSDSELATVPVHLHFQHMVEVLRAPQEEGRSLTTMLADLRQRATSDLGGELNPGQRQLADVVNEVRARTAPDAQERLSADLWREEPFGRLVQGDATSPSGGFPGSSRQL